MAIDGKLIQLAGDEGLSNGEKNSLPETVLMFFDKDKLVGTGFNGKRCLTLGSNRASYSDRS